MVIILKIEDIMSKKIIFCNYNDTIYDIAKLMKKYDVGFLPIVKRKKIVGTITDRDIVINNTYDKHKKIDYLISNNVKSIEKDMTLEEGLEIMSEYKIKRLIVTDNKKVVGILSLSDIVGKINNDKFVNAFKSIYEIDKNENDFEVEIDEFYL